MDTAAVQERARGENFPVASLLFPRALRPHLRAVYGYCRLVDILGDEIDGDRLGRAGRARARAGRLLRRRADLARAGRAPADDRGIRPPARAVPAADRGESHGPARRVIRDLGRPALVLRPLGRPGRPARARAAAADPRGGSPRGVRRRLHRAPARQLPAGRAARPRARAGLPARRGPAAVRGRASSTARARSSARCSSSRRSARAGCSPRERCSRSGSAAGSGAAVGLFARGGLAALAALERARLGRLHRAAAPVEGPARLGGVPVTTTAEAYAEVERLTRRRARNFAYGIMVLPRPKRARSRRSTPSRAASTTSPTASCPSTRSAPGSRSCTRSSTRPPGDDFALVALADARGRYPIPARRCTRSWTAACRTSR